MSSESLILEYYSIGCKSAVGDSRRRYEDRARCELVQSHLGPLIVGVVADGVGSADFGANAAQIAVDTVFSAISQATVPTVPEMIDLAIKTANQAVNDENAHKEGNGLTTLVLVIIHKDRAYVGNVGDSRAYWVQASGKLVQLTQDHTYFAKYGGDPTSVEASAVVNAIGLHEKVGVDIGFYVDKNSSDKKRAFSLGMAGLPLADGDSIILCSDGLIKSDDSGQRFATDEEIIDAVQSEFAPSAVIKMVGYAEGRKVDDNVSVISIQRLSPERIALMENRKAALKRGALIRKVAISGLITFLVVGLGFAANALFRSQKELAAAQNATPVVIQITNTPLPSPTPTIPIDPGKARVEQVGDSGRASYISADGTAGMLMTGAYIDSGVLLNSSEGSVRVIVGEVQGSPSTIMLLPTSSARLSFSDKVVIELTQGRVYIEPGNRGGMVTLPMFGDVAARLLEGGGHMVVSIMSETQVAVLCFKGPCEVRVPIGTDLSWVTVKDGEKRIFDFSSGNLLPGEVMTHAEQWEINVACNYCMYDFIPTPTPTPGQSSDGQTKVTQPPEEEVDNRTMPTKIKVTTEAPTEVTTEAPTEVTTEAPTETPTETATEEPTKEKPKDPPNP